MRTLLFTGYDEAMAPLGDLTAPLMAEYARLHGLDFKLLRTPPTNKSIYWTGVCGALRGFDDGYDKVIYLDADQMITNMEKDPPELGDGFNVSRDWGVDAVHPWSFSMCGFTATPEAKPVFEWCSAHELEWRDKPFPEQAPMQYAFKEFDWAARVMRLHETTVFNCVPIEVHPTVVYPWRKGDWTCHLTMLPLAERVALFHKKHVEVYGA